MKRFSLLFILICAAGFLHAGEPWHAGPLFDHFDLTLDPGERSEAVGPFYYSEKKDSQRQWAIPPLFSWTRDPDTESEEIDFAYPIVTYDRYGGQYRWHIMQLFAFSGGPTQVENERHRFTLFPVYFQQRSSDPSQNYTAVFPIYGHLDNRLFRDEISFIMFPIYGQSRKKDVVTDNYFFPFYHVRHGNGLKGWQLWPFYGQEHKEVTTKTNGFGDVETVGGHDKKFIMSPLWAEQRTGIGTENPVWLRTSIPAFSLERSPQRDVTTVLWPLFSWIDDREKKYREKQIPWPFVVIARGEGKTTTRFFPFYSRAHSAILESDFYMWPIYGCKQIHADPLYRRRTRIALFLYSDRIAKNTETGAFEQRRDFWPFYTWKHDFNGNTRLQVLSVLEPYLPTNRSVERDYSPIYSFWRAEKNPRTGCQSESLFWNLYRRESTPVSKKCSLLFGLFQYQSDAKSKRVRLLYIPMGKNKSSATTAEPEPVKQ